MLISIEGHSVADFDTQSAFNRWWTTTFKASWIQSTLYDFRLDGPAIRGGRVSGPFALGPFALQVGPFALIIKTYFNEHNGYFNLKYRSNDMKKYGN